ncbi:hypothetical protein L289_1361 [Acinetobacter gerneri DSM 14967 = CIP 107464 = MTCC 9824]|nr:hypothetical protein L289_1361 [Acinetobacter gerneri DSM 14967 = CIP 107464 = MTCC 9824]
MRDHELFYCLAESLLLATNIFSVQFHLIFANKQHIQHKISADSIKIKA